MRLLLRFIVLCLFVVGLSAQSKPTVDHLLSEAALLKLQLASTTLERDILRIEKQADEAKQKAQQAYQQALQQLAGKDCTLAAGPEGKAPVRRCLAEP